MPVGSNTTGRIIATVTAATGCRFVANLASRTIGLRNAIRYDLPLAHLLRLLGTLRISEIALVLGELDYETGGSV